METSKTQSSAQVSIIIPTYNESQNILKILKSIQEHLPKNAKTQTIVVDDNSPDGTGKLVEEYMLLANRAVAKHIFMSQNQGLIKGKQSVYRIHAKPDKDRIQDLATFLKALGFNLKNKEK